MIKKITEERHFCDKCGDDAVYGCIGCDHDTCLKCRDETFKGLFQSIVIDVDTILPVCNTCYDKPPKKISKRLKITIKIDQMVKDELERRQKISDEIIAFQEKYFPKPKKI